MAARFITLFVFIGWDAVVDRRCAQKEVIVNRTQVSFAYLLFAY